MARSREALRETEALFSGAFHYSPLGMAIVGADGTYLRANRVFCDILGYSEEELLHKTYHEITYPEDAAISLEYERRIRAGELDSYSLEKRYVHADGHPVWASLSVTLVRDPEGQPLYFISQVQDITERKKREEELRESQARFASAFEHAAIGMSLISTEGRWLRVNKALCEITGYSEQELLAKGFQDITHPDDLEAGIARFRGLLAGEVSSYQVEKRYFHKRGHIIWILLSASLVRDARGEPLYVVSQVQDITERKRSEEALRESEERYRSLVQLSPDVVAVQSEGRLLYINDAGAEVLGASSPEEILGKSVLDFVHPHYREAVKERSRLLYEEKRPVDVTEQKLIRLDGRVVDVEVAAVPIVYEGKPAAQVVFRDITDYKRTEEALKRLNENLEARNRELVQKSDEIEMFVYSVSHDLRAPLVNLLGFSRELELIGEDIRAIFAGGDLPPEVQERGLALVDEDMATSLRFIRAGVRRLSSIIDALLRLSRVGQVEYRRQRVELNDVVGRVVDSMKETIAEKEAIVALKKLPPAWGDPAAMEQAFAGLIENGLSYLDPDRPGLIEVGHEPAGDSPAGYNRYYVKDNGLGIPEQGVQSVFQAFQRLHPQVTKGEGVGLTLVQRIVERHGGKIWVESTQGEGSIFFMELPGVRVARTEGN